MTYFDHAWIAIWRQTHVSHPLEPEGRRVGAHVALEVDVVPRPEVVRVEVAAQPQGDDGGV